MALFTSEMFSSEMFSSEMWANGVGVGVGVAWTPAALFAAEAYGWAIVAPNTVWADTAGTTPGVVGQTIRRLDDQRGAPWIGATTGPTYRVTDGIDWLEFAAVDGRQLNITVPSITNGTLMIAHKNAGVMSGNVTIPAGTYTIGRWDSYGIVGVLLIDRNLSQSEREQVRQWFIDERGAGSFSAVTNFTLYQLAQSLTSVDLFDTSSSTTFTQFLQDNKLTSVPLFNTAAGTNFTFFLSKNKLTSVPLFNTAAGTNFYNFLSNNKLTSVPLFNTAAGTNFYAFLLNNQLTTVPLFDTANGTNFSEFLAINQLTSIPLFDTSSGTVFSTFARNNPLTTVPAGLFDNVKGTDFTNAFLGCALTQQSVDNVLVSIATAAAANNLDNGTLTGLDSGTNAAPSATGVAAKNELIARGWTVSTN